MHATLWPGRHCSTVAFFSSKSFDLACYCSRYRSSTISHFQESERRRLAVSSKKLSVEHRDSPLVVRLIFLGFLSSHLVACLFYSPCSIPLAFSIDNRSPVQTSSQQRWQGNSEHGDREILRLTNTQSARTSYDKENQPYTSCYIKSCPYPKPISNCVCPTAFRPSTSASSNPVL